MLGIQTPFCSYPFGNVTNDCHSSDDCPMCIVQRKAGTIEVSVLPRLRNTVRYSRTFHSFTFNCFPVGISLSDFLQERKYLKRRFAKHLFAGNAGYLFHSLVPERVADVFVVRKNTVLA